LKKALIQLHFSVFLAGFTGILGVLIHLNEMSLVWYRIMITVLSLTVYFKITQQPVHLSRKLVIRFLCIGGLIALHWVAFYGSIKLSNVSIGLVCFSATGLFTALLEPLLVTKNIQWAELGLGVLSLAGIYLIFHFDERYQLGILIGILSAFLAALFSVLNKQVVDKAPPLVMMQYELTGGLLLLTVLMPAYMHFFPTMQLLPTLSDIGWLLVLSWLCTIVAMQLMLTALKQVSAFTQNLSLNLEPVYAIIMAFLFFNENKYLSASFYYGVALIVLSVVLQMIRVLFKSKLKTQQ